MKLSIFGRFPLDFQTPCRATYHHTSRFGVVVCEQADGSPENSWPRGRFWTLQRKGKSLLFSRGDSNAKSAGTNSTEEISVRCRVFGQKRSRGKHQLCKMDMVQNCVPEYLAVGFGRNLAICRQRFLEI